MQDFIMCILVIFRDWRKVIHIVLHATKKLLNERIPGFSEWDLRMASVYYCHTKIAGVWS